MASTSTTKSVTVSKGKASSKVKGVKSAPPPLKVGKPSERAC